MALTKKAPEGAFDPEYWDGDRMPSTWEDLAHYYRSRLDLANSRIAGLKLRVAQLEAQLADDETFGLMLAPDAEPSGSDDLENSKN